MSEDEDEDTETGPPTLAEHQLMQRWKLRDKCLRIATYYRVLRLHDRAAHRNTMQRLRPRFANWAASLIRHTQHMARLTAHREHTQAARSTRQDLVSSSTRMHMIEPVLYRETRRRNARATETRPHRRTRLPTLVDTEISHGIYKNMRTIAARCRSWRLHDPG